MSAPEPRSADAPEYVEVDRFPKTIAWCQVTFLALVSAATLLPLAAALALAA